MTRGDDGDGANAWERSVNERQQRLEAAEQELLKAKRALDNAAGHLSFVMRMMHGLHMTVARAGQSLEQSVDMLTAKRGE